MVSREQLKQCIAEHGLSIVADARPLVKELLADTRQEMPPTRSPNDATQSSHPAKVGGVPGDMVPSSTVALDAPLLRRVIPA